MNRGNTCLLYTSVLTYVSGHVIFADYLELQRMPMVSEVTVFCGAMTGASIGFLWYNAHPAEIFMGDVGSPVSYTHLSANRACRCG